MPNINLYVDKKTAAELEELQKFFKVASRPALFKRLIAIGIIAKDKADKDGHLYIEKQGVKNKKDRMFVVSLVD